MSMRSLDPLLQPLDLKHVRLRNRVVSTSHEPGYAEDGMPKSRYRLYHVEKAHGGVGLTMIGGSSIVAADSPPAFGNLHLYKDEIVRPLADLAEAVHEAGAAVMCQVSHLGRRTSNYAADWLPIIAPSLVREPAHRSFPKIAEDWDLERIIAAYTSAAQRCQAAGLDGIELEAYGHLMDSFWSPATNRRDDSWGGDPERRLRFPLAVIRAVRDAVGHDFVVGIRMAVYEDIADGISKEEGLAIARRVADEGIDFISVIQGTIGSHLAQSKVIPSMGTPAAPYLPLAGEVRRAVDVPVMHAARIADVATARHALREGLVDLVGMMRAQVADPHLVAKVASGEEDRIRPCVGASFCIDSTIQPDGAMLCIHNVATGREERLPHRIPAASARRRAVVVGAGPAGLEAARVLAERGHEVVLFEAAAEPGGQVTLASFAPRRRDLVGIIDWRVDECKRLGVDLRFGVYAERHDVLAENPHIVVIATGGLPNRDILSFGTDLVHDTWDVLSRTVQLNGDVLVYDDNGSYPALDAAEVLARCGARVAYLSPERTFAPDLGSVTYPGYLEQFGRYGVSITLNMRLVGVKRGDGRLVAHLLDEYAEQPADRVVDHVVVEHGTAPMADLYFELQSASVNHGEVDLDALVAVRPQRIRRNESGSYQLFRVGDAVASRNVHAAMLDAYRLCLVL